jgi:hypothetical protein
MYKGSAVPGISKSHGSSRSSVSSACDNDELLRRLKRKRELSYDSGGSTSDGNPKQGKQESVNYENVRNLIQKRCLL